MISCIKKEKEINLDFLFHVWFMLMCTLLFAKPNRIIKHLPRAVHDFYPPNFN